VPIEQPLLQPNVQNNIGSYHQERKHTENIPQIKKSIPKIIYFSASILSIIIGLILFVLTCMQFSSKVETSKGNLSGSDPCSTAKYRPLRFSFQGDDEYISCTWSINSNVGRFFLSLFISFFPLFGLWSVYKKKSWAVYLYGIFSVILSLALFIMMCSDANDVRLSSSWCDGGLQGLELSPSDVGINCSYAPYVSTCLTEVGAMFGWIIVSVVSIRHVRKYWA